MQSPSGNPTPSFPTSSSESRSITARYVHITPDWNAVASPFRHTWEGILNVDQFRWLVRRDMQEQLALAQRELKATHVRAVGMFDDEMRVFCQSPASFMGTEPAVPRSNWQTIDYVFDSLLDRGLQPMFTTSFVPSAMASGATTVFSTRAHTSPPQNWQQWEEFVRDAVQHAVDRYSIEVVRQWPFEVWNEPNLLGWFWGGTLEDFKRLWHSTYRAIKSVDSRLRVGGPSTARAEWLEELIDFGATHNCLPDYLITHIYHNDSAVDHPLAPFDPSATERGSDSPHFAMEIMRNVRALLDHRNFKGELHWNEWGRSFHAVDHRREHPSEAAFIARLLSEVSQEADVFSYWCLSDIYDQVGYGREAFFGGYGLLNLQGLRKPAYHAFELMAKLGQARLPAALSPRGNDGWGTIVTTGDTLSHVLVHADNTAAGQPEHRQSMEVSVSLLRGMRPLRLFRIDSSENNVLALWDALGQPAYLSRDQTRELAANNVLTPSSTPIRLENTADGAIACFTMESPGVALLEVSRV